MRSIKSLREEFHQRAAYADPEHDVVLTAEMLSETPYKTVPEKIRKQWLAAQIALNEVKKFLGADQKGCHCGRCGDGW